MRVPYLGLPNSYRFPDGDFSITEKGEVASFLQQSCFALRESNPTPYGVFNRLQLHIPPCHSLVFPDSAVAERNKVLQIERGSLRFSVLYAYSYQNGLRHTKVRKHSRLEQHILTLINN
ncbi:hypothetical protein SUGI_0533230 [Cryptomeria japonica]|nr:hypothetical protein SUGI_0533230 [Cryptomeria japonica]